MFRLFGALVLLVGTACSGAPSGPTSPAGSPTGSIYISWWPSGVEEMQVYRVSAHDGHYQQVEIPYYTLSPEFDVDVAGRGLLFQPPGPSFVWMPGFESWRIREFGGRGHYYSPLLSPSLRLAATVIVAQFTPRNLMIFDLKTAASRVVATLPKLNTCCQRVNHWFAAGDSLLVSWINPEGFFEYHVVQVDGSGMTPFEFPLAKNATYLQISPDESRLAIASPRIGDSHGFATGTIEIYDIQPPRLVRSMTLPYRVGEIAWSPDGTYLAFVPVGIDEGIVSPILEIVNVATGNRTILIEGDSRGAHAREVEWARQ